jgi:hypothetical protein
MPRAPEYSPLRPDVGSIVTCRRARLCVGAPSTPVGHSIVKGLACWRFTHVYTFSDTTYRHGAHLCLPCAVTVGVATREG